MNRDNFYIDYDESTEMFIVYQIQERHDNGSIKLAEPIAECHEEGWAYKIMSLLNDRKP